MAAEENVFLDDCAMRPLKALGEENRRKSAPAFHHVLRDSTEWRVNDNDENLSSRIVSDDDESFLSTDTDPALDSYRRSRSLDSRRIGQWQGKVEYALRKSVALDASMSPVNRWVEGSLRFAPQDLGNLVFTFWCLKNLENQVY